MTDLGRLARQVGHELTALRRSPITLILSVGFPLVFFVLLAALLGNVTLDDRMGIRLAQFIAPGLATFGVVMATFSFLAVGFAEARASGVLTRQAGTPVPAWVLLGGRIGAATLLGLVATALVLGVGAIGYDVQLFARSAAAVVVTLLLGSVTFAALGLAAAAWLPSPGTTLAVTNGLVVPLSFVSDVFMAGQMPDWMTRLAWFFPLKHVAVLFGDALNPYLTGSGFQADHLAAVAGWGLVGAVAARAGLRRDRSRPAGVAGRTTVRARPADALARTGRPSAAALLLAEVRHGQAVLWRDPSSVFFAVVFPVLLVAVVPLVNGGGTQPMSDGRTLGSLFAATMAVYGAAVTAYVNMPVELAENRDRGVLKRRRGSPQPLWVLLTGRVVAAVVVAVLTLVAVYLLAAAMYRVGVPPAWPLALAVFVLGVVTLAVVGIAVSALAPTAQAATGLALGTLLPLAFVSDIFIVGVELPPVLDAIAGFFPVRPFVRAMVAATADPGAVAGGQLAVLAGWLAAGLVVLGLRFGREVAARARRAAIAGAS